MNELREMLCEELDEITAKGKLNMSDLDAVHKLTDTIKNIDKIGALNEGYSSDGGWNASGTYSRNRDRSYGRHYVRGHYSYGDMDRIERMMNDGNLSASEKDTLRRAMEIIKR